jgi:hypothetical protein
MLAISVLTATVAFLSATILIFATAKELRDSTYGKIVLCMLSSLMITFVSFPFAVHRWFGASRSVAEYVSVIGMILTGLWLFALTFDVFKSLR